MFPSVGGSNFLRLNRGWRQTEGASRDADSMARLVICPQIKDEYGDLSSGAGHKRLLFFGFKKGIE